MNQSIYIAFLLSAVLVAVDCVGYLPGSKHSIPVNSPELVKTLMAVERSMDEVLESEFVHRIGKILAAKQQVVSGYRYQVNFEFNKTNCRKSDKPDDIKKCKLEDSYLTCRAELFSQPWKGHRDFLTFNCDDKI